MAQLTIDLSGRKGLAPRFWGDVDRTTSVSRRRILGSPGQMADGIYNPMRRYGYLSPANATMQAVTASAGSFGSQLASSIYDMENDDFYFAERGMVIWRGDTLDDTSITSVLDLEGTGSPKIYDLEIYQINGVRKMFVIYEADDALNVGISSLPYDNSTDDPNWLSGGTLDYDGQTGNFTAGLKVTGGTSGATAWIVSDSDSGATGTLTLRYVKGIFANNETITDSSTGSAAVDGTMSFTTTGGFGNAVTGDAFMEVADNGFAYLFQDNVVHKIDGTTNGGSTGTITPNVLTFPAYFRTVDAVDYKGLMFMAIHQFSTETRTLWEATRAVTMKMGVYIWDRLSTIVDTRDFIPVHGCKEIRKIYVAPNGKVRLFAVNSENVAVIMEYNGSGFVPIIETGILSFPRFRDSLTTVGGMTMWLGAMGDVANPDAVVYAHGKITPGDDEALYKIGTITDFIAPGAILFGGANADATTTSFKRHKTGLYLGYATAAAAISMAEFDIHGTGADGVSAVGLGGDVYTQVFPLPQMATVKHIDIYMLNTSASSSTSIGTVGIYFNSVASQWASKSITLADAATGHKRIQVNQPYVNSVQLLITFGGSIATGGDEFAPYLAVITYEPTGTTE